MWTGALKPSIQAHARLANPDGTMTLRLNHARSLSMVDARGIETTLRPRQDA